MVVYSWGNQHTQFKMVDFPAMLDYRRVYLFKSPLSLGFNGASDNSATALCQCFAVPHAVIRALYLEFHRNTPRNAAFNSAVFPPSPEKKHHLPSQAAKLEGL